jgi:hypothetical protein
MALGSRLCGVLYQTVISGVEMCGIFNDFMIDFIILQRVGFHKSKVFFIVGDKTA